MADRKKRSDKGQKPAAIDSIDAGDQELVRKRFRETLRSMLNSPPQPRTNRKQIPKR